MKQILKNIRHVLTELADEKTRESNMRFFKETEHQKVRLYGLKSADARKVSREQFAAVKDMSKEATKRPGLGIRLTKLVPDGTT